MSTTNVNISDLERAKQAKLESYLKELGSIAIAFSGGVDSTFLLTEAHKVLGDKAIAVTANLNSVPSREAQEAKEFCESKGIRHIIVELNEFEIPGFAENPPDRCYICKTGVFTALLNAAKENGIEHVAEGSNMDDLGDYRPGMKALRELEILSPLREAELYKQEIRNLSHELDLPTWNRSSAACLASRFVYGEIITKEKLTMVDKAEQFIRDLGFEQLRVRMHGEDLARIEVLPNEIERLIQNRELIVNKLTEIGFTYITVDAKGYRMGSMNEVL